MALQEIRIGELAEGERVRVQGLLREKPVLAERVGFGVAIGLWLGADSRRWATCSWCAA